MDIALCAPRTPPPHIRKARVRQSSVFLPAPSLVSHASFLTGLSLFLLKPVVHLLVSDSWHPKFKLVVSTPLCTLRCLPCWDHGGKADSSHPHNKPNAGLKRMRRPSLGGAEMRAVRMLLMGQKKQHQTNVHHIVSLPCLILAPRSLSCLFFRAMYTLRSFGPLFLSSTPWSPRILPVISVRPLPIGRLLPWAHSHSGT